MHAEEREGMAVGAGDNPLHFVINALRVHAARSSRRPAHEQNEAPCLAGPVSSSASGPSAGLGSRSLAGCLPLADFSSFALSGSIHQPRLSAPVGRGEPPARMRRRPHASGEGTGQGDFAQDRRVMASRGCHNAAMPDRLLVRESLPKVEDDADAVQDAARRQQSDCRK
jgi:hypothetical protein